MGAKPVDMAWRHVPFRPPVDVEDSEISVRSAFHHANPRQFSSPGRPSPSPIFHRIKTFSNHQGIKERGITTGLVFRSFKKAITSVRPKFSDKTIVHRQPTGLAGMDPAGPVPTARATDLPLSAVITRGRIKNHVSDGNRLRCRV